MQLPFFMPGIPVGQERSELVLLEATIGDLRRYCRGECPDPEALAAAPVINDWVPMTDPGSCHLQGIAGHPSSADPVVVETARVVAVSRSGSWMLTRTGLWRLGPPLFGARHRD